MTRYCPSIDDCHAMILSLLPKGKAHQTGDAAIRTEDSKLKIFAYALSQEWYELEAKICSTIDEFFCSTTVEDRDVWLEEYGLPDECDPFGNNLCAKVGALGGTTIAYYQELATQLGWTTTMRWLKGDDAEFPGIVSTLHIEIDSQTSPSAEFTVIELGDTPEWELGASTASEELSLGEPNLTGLICAFLKIIPAHTDIISEVT